MAPGKYYVVWKGRRRGVFRTWMECEDQVKGFVGAQYKAFGTRPEAEAAFKSPYKDFAGKPASLGRWKAASVPPVLPSLCVDAACKGARGPLEYRGVNTETADQVFHAGPFEGGTNNIGEFLAIVHALSWLEKRRSRMPVYTDSETAIAWVYTGQCKTRLEHTSSHAAVFALVHSAENWLAENELPERRILKWDTDLWGEIPADFGRK
jgi:ribonuclease HI